MKYFYPLKWELIDLPFSWIYYIFISKNYFLEYKSYK